MDLPAGLGSTALVLSIAAPFGGSYWYGLTALSPLAGYYYWQRGSRQEEFAVRYFVIFGSLSMHALVCFLLADYQQLS